MKVICISDTHLNHVKDLPDGDLLIHAGDWSSSGTIVQQHNFERYVKNVLCKKYKSIVIIAGNHDFIAEENHLYTKETLEVPGQVYYLNDSGIEINGFKIWGSPVTPRFLDGAFNKDRGEDIRKHWDLIPDGTDIVITHGPVIRIGDKLEHNSENVGCVDLFHTLVNRVMPMLHVCGHIHEGYGKYEMGKTTFVNASILNEKYKQVNKPIVIEL